MSAIGASTLIRARFGIPIDHDAGRERSAQLRAQADALARQLDGSLRAGRLALITGPSGSGKSLLLRALSRRLDRWVAAPPIDHANKAPTIELLAGSIEDRLRLLGACGLADAHPLVTPAGQLSDGQKARLALALAFEQAESIGERCTVLVDEFCSTLDRTTAASVAASVRRLVRPTCRFVCASANDDLIEHLRPDVLVYVPLEGTPEILTRNDSCAHIPGRSCPSMSENDSNETIGTPQGPSVSARAPLTTMPGSPGCITEPRLRRRSSA
ncbi:MAG: AAA family ATPase [Phycisphaerales bacterium JB061]